MTFIRTFFTFLGVMILGAVALAILVVVPFAVVAHIDLTSPFEEIAFVVVMFVQLALVGAIIEGRK